MPINDKFVKMITSCLAIAALSLPLTALAQSATWMPVKPVRVVIPFSPGALPDIIARLISPKLSEALGQQVLVDNRAGATGAIGLDFVSKSPPDGHTLGMLIITHSVNAALENSKLDVPKLPFSLVKDFTPVSQLTSNSYVLVISTKHPVRTVAELVALAKAKPGLLTYGSSGTGGIIHLAGEWLAAATKTKMTHVPYKSSALAMNEVAGAHIDMMFSSVALMNTVASSGRGRGIAATSATRMSAAPDIPTFIEAGIPGFEIDGWYGIVGPPAMPAGIVNRLSLEMAKAVKLPEVGAKLATDGAVGVGSTPAQFAALLQSEDRKWRRVVQEIGLGKTSTGDRSRP